MTLDRGDRTGDRHPRPDLADRFRPRDSQTTGAISLRLSDRRRRRRWRLLLRELVAELVNLARRNKKESVAALLRTAQVGRRARGRQGQRVALMMTMMSSTNTCQRRASSKRPSRPKFKGSGQPIRSRGSSLANERTAENAGRRVAPRSCTRPT